MTYNAPHIDRSNLLYRLSALTRRWRQVLDGAFKSVGLTDASWRPLLHLHCLGDGIHQKELAASVGIQGPSLVRLLDALLAKGLIVRAEDAHDRRAKQLYLTADGLALVERIRATVTLLEHDLLAPFSDDEISRLAAVIEQLEGAVERARENRLKTP
jgi:MarR family transcriptional regulator for hemolysin